MLYNGIPRVSCQKTDPVDWGFGDILPFVSFCDIPIHHSCHLRTGEEKKTVFGKSVLKNKNSTSRAGGSGEWILHRWIFGHQDIQTHL